MSRYWSKFVQRLKPYVPGEQPIESNLVKLNTNENPYPPAPAVLEAIQLAANADLRLYPDPESFQLKQTIANYYDVAPNNVFVGNGSDEVLAHAFHAFFQQAQPLLLPDISYSFYPVYCDLYDIQYQPVPLDENFSIVVEDYFRDNGGIIFPNPNAPTGVLLAQVELQKLLAQNTQSVVIVDEAYIDFADTADSASVSAIELSKQFDNLLVIQTLSKSRSLAGIRLGFAIGHEGLIDALTRVKNCFNSYPIDRVAEQAAIASFGDESYYQTIRKRIIDSRRALTRDLEQLGFECLPSSANFLMARHPQRSAESLKDALREQQIIVRHFSQDRVKSYLRISIGTDDENRQLIDSLSHLLRS